MDIHLSAEQEAQFTQMAASEGKGAEELAYEMLRDALAEKTIRYNARGKDVERSKRSRAEEIIASILEERRGNFLPDGVTIDDLIRDGRA